MNYILPAIAGILAGVISAWGVGGGTLLVIYMSLFTKTGQQTAQGINLIYFLPVSAAALISHIKNKLVVWRAVLPAVLAGVPAAVAASLFAMSLDTGVLRKIFGGFVLAVGLFELFSKEKTGNGENRK